MPKKSNQHSSLLCMSFEALGFIVTYTHQLPKFPGILIKPSLPQEFILHLW